MASKLSGKPARIDFAEAAARFDEIARNVKAQQAAAYRGRDGAVLPAEAPEEIWARQYMSQAIGRRGLSTPAAAMPVSHPDMIAPDMVTLRSALARAREMPKDLQGKAVLDLPQSSVAGSAPMSMRIGRREEKEKSRRSWLRRWFRGPNR